MKIAVAGTGYVGLSNSMIFAQHHEVVAVDIIQDKVDLLNNKISPIQDADISNFLKEKLTESKIENLALLTQAISKSESLQPSPLFNASTL